MVHGCMVYTERGETAAVSRGTSHVQTKQRCKYTTSVDIHNALYKKLQTLILNHMRQERTESTREQRIALYKIHQQHQQLQRYI